MRTQGKHSFFEKKEQKTFALSGDDVAEAVKTRCATLTGLDPVIHAAVQAVALEAETKCRASTQRLTWRNGVDARIKSGQGELGARAHHASPQPFKSKVFCFFFSKKKRWPCLPGATP